jgi:hypothetical protein
MNVSRRRLVIGLLVLVLGLAAIGGFGGGSDGGGYPGGGGSPQDGGAYFEQTPGGSIGSDGSTSYYSDPTTGCSFVSGEGVRC